MTALKQDQVAAPSLYHGQSTDRRWLGWWRRLAAGLGVAGLIAIALAGANPLTSQFSLTVLELLALAAIFGIAQSRWDIRRLASDEARRAPRSHWLAVALALGLGLVLATQTWFHAGTSISGSDTPPPDGSAWLSRIFTSWTWSGSNMGGPSFLEPQLPWATVLSIVHTLGGSPELAQRIWYTLLFVGAGLAALALLAALDLPPIASAIGATVYVLNGYVVSTVGTNPEFLAALALLPILPAIVLSASKRQISLGVALVLFASVGPFLGFVYNNPPMVGMILAVAISSPIVAAILGGRAYLLRSLLILALGLPLLVAVSSYWIVPATEQLGSVASAQLSPVIAWSWTEGRANIPNAFWLNTFWGWDHPEYVPFAQLYNSPPLSWLKFAIPILAFASLIISSSQTGTRARVHLALASTAGLVAVTVIFISTGTNPPGNIVFDSLYNLPFGWLLREPGRFLMVVGLAYAVMTGLTVEATLNVRGAKTLMWFRSEIHILLARQSTWSRSLPDIRSTTFGRLANRLPGVVTLAVVPLAIALAAFPLVTGAIVPDARSLLPSGHVAMPPYWSEMARYVNASPVRGSILVLPPDDFYQMPYRWGYYGTDSFVPQFFDRPVVLPNPEGGYSAQDAQFQTAVDLTNRSILAGHWDEVQRLVSLLRTPLVLVRGDVDTSYAGRVITSPDSLASALDLSPNFILVHQSGPLRLYSLGRDLPLQTYGETNFVTVDNRSPDLRALALLPNDVALVSSPAIGGIPVLIQAPPETQWKKLVDGYEWDLVEPNGWEYRLGVLDENGAARFLPTPLPVADALTEIGISSTVGTGGETILHLYAQHVDSTVGVVALGYPEGNRLSNQQLLVVYTTFSPAWHATGADRQVLVDGLVNGWFMNADATRFTVTYASSDWIGFALSSATVAGVLIFVLLVALRSRVALVHQLWESADHALAGIRIRLQPK